MGVEDHEYKLLKSRLLNIHHTKREHPRVAGKFSVELVGTQTSIKTFQGYDLSELGLSFITSSDLLLCRGQALSLRVKALDLVYLIDKLIIRNAEPLDELGKEVIYGCSIEQVSSVSRQAHLALLHVLVNNLHLTQYSACQKVEQMKNEMYSLFRVCDQTHSLRELIDLTNPANPIVALSHLIESYHLGDKLLHMSADEIKRHLLKFELEMTVSLEKLHSELTGLQEIELLQGEMKDLILRMVDFLEAQVEDDYS